MRSLRKKGGTGSKRLFIFHGRSGFKQRAACIKEITAIEFSKFFLMRKVHCYVLITSVLEQGKKAFFILGFFKD